LKSRHHNRSLRRHHRLNILWALELSQIRLPNISRQ
jgi:hypothetical protein